MATPSQKASSIRTILKDYNYWPGSESDSSLAIKTYKGTFSNDKLLSLDGSARKKAAKEAGTEGYKLPGNRRIGAMELDEVFRPMISAAVDNVNAAKGNIDAGVAELVSMELPAENLEFSTQLYSAFAELSNPKVYKVDAEGEPTVNLFIVGELQGLNGIESVFATTTLVNT